MTFLRLFLCLIMLAGIPKMAKTGEWSFNPRIAHMGQPENWICGPTTIAMWAGFIRLQSLDPYSIANSCCGTNGTNMTEFLSGIFYWTPYGYVFSEWEYEDKHAGVKGLMWSIARFQEPVAIVGGMRGSHYLLVRGGRAEKHPFQYYGSDNSILGLWVNDATEDSPHYSKPVSGMYQHREYAPTRFDDYWWKIGAWGDKKYRSIERGCYGCWHLQGATLENNDSFWSY